MGLLVSVYRSVEIPSDCTLGGISGKFTKLCLVNVEGPFNPSADAPAALLESHHKGCLSIVEAVEGVGIVAGMMGKKWQQRPGWCMMGGNYAATSDSRFSEACEKLLGHRFYGAVPIHDRYEG